MCLSIFNLKSKWISYLIVVWKPVKRKSSSSTTNFLLLVLLSTDNLLSCMTNFRSLAVQNYAFNITNKSIFDLVSKLLAV